MGMRLFDNRELEATDRILRHVERGGIAVLEGRWERVLRLWDWVKSRCRDRGLLDRLTVRASGDWVRSVEPPLHLPCLSLVAGGTHGGDYLVPLQELLAVMAAHETFHPVEALGASLVVYPNVLIPRSQPLIHLLRRAMEAMAPDLPAAPDVLDMGCGSGVCALVAARVWPEARITATDHLPEAAASARVNVARLEAQGLIRPGAVRVAEPGDLFDPVAGERYDLIIFNAPWVVAPARTRAETALNDAGQATLRRFLHGAVAHLNPGGRVLLGYANHSGPKAIANLERFAVEAGLQILQRQGDRIKTHRSHRAWQAIYAYDLGPTHHPVSFPRRPTTSRLAAPVDAVGRRDESHSVTCTD